MRWPGFLGGRRYPSGLVARGDPLFKQKERWGEALLERLLRYAEWDAARDVARCVIENGFRTDSFLEERTVTVFVDVIIPIVLPPDVGSRREIVRKDVHRLDVPGLLRSEEDVARRLFLSWSKRWLYAFAAIKLVLLVTSPRDERRVGPREAVLAWTALRLQEAGAGARSIEESAEAWYGSLSGLPG
ncbi:MAG: hypothetical protein HZC42_06550 [Candidatus Eisenbacteria bacterium]|nr:hypothetical protein [Candidatus Eisenbacteria bacterium]